MQQPSSTDLRGIDVSRWQGDIDWQAVRGAGVELCYIKASEGASLIDPDFDRNVKGAQAAGIPCGFYHTMNATDVTDARTQAEYFAAVTGGRTAAARPVGEMTATAALTAQEFTAVCLAFLERLEELTGVRPMICATAGTARRCMQEPLAAYPLWVANYGVAVPEGDPVWARWTGFRHSDTGRMAGIATRVGLDRFTRDALISSSLPLPAVPALSRYRSGAMYYTVQPGDTLDMIARRYDAAQRDVISWNHIRSADLLHPGQVLRLYTPRAVVPQSGEILHSVRPGDDLRSLAQLYGVSAQALADASGVGQPYLIRPGQVLNVPAAGVIPRPTPAVYALDRTVEVLRGDTLSGIARRYGLTWQELALANGIADPARIYPGQLLRLEDSPLAGVVGSFTGHYVVQRGDTQAHIAARFGTSAAELRTANALTADQALPAGRVLRIQPDGW